MIYQILVTKEWAKLKFGKENNRKINEANNAESTRPKIPILKAIVINIRR